MDTFLHDAARHFWSVEVDDDEGDSAVYRTAPRRSAGFLDELREIIELLPEEVNRQEVESNCLKCVNQLNMNKKAMQTAVKAFDPKRFLDEFGKTKGSEAAKSFDKNIFAPLQKAYDEKKRGKKIYDYLLKENGFPTMERLFASVKNELLVPKREKIKLARKARRKHGKGTTGFFAYVLSLLGRIMRLSLTRLSEVGIFSIVLLYLFCFRQFYKQGIEVNDVLQQTVVDTFLVADLAEEIRGAGLLTDLTNLLMFQEKNFLLDKYNPYDPLTTRVRFSSTGLQNITAVKIPINVLQTIIPYEDFASKEQLEVLDKIPLNFDTQLTWLNTFTDIKEKYRLQKERERTARDVASKVVGKTKLEMAKIMTSGFFSLVKGANLQSLIADFGSYMTNRILDNFKDISIGLAEEGAKFYARTTVVSVSAEYQRRLNKCILEIAQSLITHLILQALLLSLVKVVEQKRDGKDWARIGRLAFSLNRFYASLMLIVKGLVLYSTDVGVAKAGNVLLSMTAQDYAKHGTVVQTFLLCFVETLGAVGLGIGIYSDGKKVLKYLLSEAPKAVLNSFQEKMAEKEQKRLKL
tara:strand:+ start:1951 stop:3684 length:1734 start_codon:yes stop_codon:yes gene_type:complete